jgi:hypothetical protein
MTFTKNIIASAVLLATSSLAIAATDTTTVQINVTKDAYVNFIGTLSTSPTVALDVATLAGTSTLGTLGLESNTTGTCTVSFASTNDYKLVHTVDSTLNLGTYSIAYAGVTNTSGTSLSYTSGLGGCDTAGVASDFTITHPALPAVVTAGTYNDTLTMVVTTQ